MDPGRVKAYLQVACTGLGFDIGEIWWATDNNGSSSPSSSLMALGEFFHVVATSSDVERELDWLFRVFAAKKCRSGVTFTSCYLTISC